MKVSQRLYEKALPIWESYFTHPFIQGMADGTLAGGTEPRCDGTIAAW